MPPPSRRRKEGRQFKEPHFAFLPAEWPHEDYSTEMNAASDALSSWMDSCYRTEAEHIGPGDDHLRPWKRVSFEVVVELLVAFRESVIAPRRTPIWLTCHDPNEGMVSWIKAGVERLNSPATFDKWHQAWAYWYR